MRESVYFNKERSVGQLFGFHQKVLEPHSTKFFRSDQTVNILKINTIRLECNIIFGSYVDNTPTHTLHEFGINDLPGYKIPVTPHNLIYFPINCDEISTLSIRIVDQNGDLVYLRGENVLIRMHIWLIERLFIMKDVA